MRYETDTEDLSLTIRFPRSAWRELVAAVARELGASVEADLNERKPTPAASTAARSPGGGISPIFVDAKELARLLSVSVSAVRLWTQRPGFPVVRFGRLVRFKVDDVVAWCEAEAGDGRRSRRW